ncbi:MAG: Dabb family protein [Bacteroidota bacterium]
MRAILFSMIAVLVLAAACTTPAPETPVAAVAESVPDSLLRHVVLFKFKDESSEADVKAVVDAFRALPSKIDAIYDFEYGTDNSPEGLADGFTHSFLVTFRTEADREVYLPHPDHQAFVGVLRPHLDKVLVIDYWTKE